MAENKNQPKSANDGLALIVGGLFVLALVFATYSYFNRTPSVVTDTSDTQGISTTNTGSNTADQEMSLTERIKELFNSSDSSTQGDVNGDGATSKTTPNTVDKETTTESTAMTDSTFWVANDYTQGEITGNSYVVKDGDTLWEIAEAKYGDGTAWTRILEANSADVGYLPSGQQALIFAGQTLVLPQN